MRAEKLRFIFRYFASGWAFLIPYLFAYLLYYLTKWPVNSTGRGIGTASALPAGIPSLLHVYWALHAVHVVFAGVALWSWWVHVRAKGQVPSAKDQVSFTDIEPFSPSALQPFGHSALCFLPWLFLALLFYIPGVYLEWPSDPWEHLRRINEWHTVDIVGAHSSWYKSAYFIPYSLLSWTTGLRQLFWLNFYYTGICLLLCWQYYRLARACGLGERAATIFVILQALLLGNNIFSFYRYYGISSSIYAQLGAVALIRIVLEFAARGTKLDPFFGHGVHGALTQSARSAEEGYRKGEIGVPIKNSGTERTESQKPFLNQEDAEIQGDTSSFSVTKPAPSRRLSGLCVRALCSLWRAPETNHSVSGFWHPSLFWLLTSGFCLLLLIAFNHRQGLGIAGFGIIAVIVWRLIAWKRSALWWLIGGMIVANVVFLWFYPRPEVIEIHRVKGYLNAWYGFNFLQLSSPAGDRMLQIVGAIGLLNLVAGLFLVRRNRVIGWLTVTPLLVLLLPCISIPLTRALVQHGGIITFQRMLFAIPPGLALIGLASEMRLSSLKQIFALRSAAQLPVGAACIALLLLLSVFPGGPGYNRSWHSLARTPADLDMRNTLRAAEKLVSRQPATADILTAPVTGFVLVSAGVIETVGIYRGIGRPSADSLERMTRTITSPKKNRPFVLFTLPATQTYTAVSLAGVLSTHWPAQQVSSSFAGGPELEAIALKAVRR